MKLNVQRLFVGNLPANITDLDIQSKFAEYGNVQSTEIKKRPDGSVFAYINLEADRRHIDECLQVVPNEKWSGHNVKVELAKESFLVRLARERKEQQCATEIDRILVDELSIENLKRENESRDQSADASHYQLTGHSPAKQTQVKSETSHSPDKPIRFKLESEEINCDENLRKKEKSSDLFAIVNSFHDTEKSAVKQIRVKLESENTKSDENLMRKKNLRKSFTDANSPRVTGNSTTKQRRVKLETAETISDQEMHQKKLPMFRGIANFLEECELQLDPVLHDHSEIQHNAKLSSRSDESKEVRENENLKLGSIHYNQKHAQPYKIKVKSDNQYCSMGKIADFQFSEVTKLNNKSTLSIRSRISENKRLKSIEEKKKSFNNQLQTVKRALSAVDAPLNKKIVFSDDEAPDDGLEKTNDGVTETYDKKAVDKPSLLFNDESSDDELDIFKIKTQFEGRKGHKLLELQSRYANDKRFTLDERFYESDESETVQDPQNAVLCEDEKTRQLNILQDVLGERIHVPLNKKEKLRSNNFMLRFDPLKEDHKRFEVAKQPGAEETAEDSKNDSTEKVTKKFKKENDVVEDAETPKIKVSKEKYYTVTDRLKETLKNKNKMDMQFSLLEMFGSSSRDEGEPSVHEKYEHSEKNKKKQIGWQRNPFKYDSSDSEDEETTELAEKPESKISESVLQKTNSVSRKCFFFTKNDARLKDGLQFLTSAKKMGEEEFVKRRRELKQIVRSKIKNNLRKKKPWKKKLGGQKKKFSKKKL